MDTTPFGPSGIKLRHANSVEVDPDRWRQAWYRRRMTLTAVSELVECSHSWANQVAYRGSCCYFKLDELASQLGEDTESLIYEVATDRERQRTPRE